MYKNVIAQGYLALSLLLVSGVALVVPSGYSVGFWCLSFVGCVGSGLFCCISSANRGRTRWRVFAPHPVWQYCAFAGRVVHGACTGSHALGVAECLDVGGVFLHATQSGHG